MIRLENTSYFHRIQKNISVNKVSLNPTLLSAELTTSIFLPDRCDVNITIRVLPGFPIADYAPSIAPFYSLLP
jgi:hypothetical protein